MGVLKDAKIENWSTYRENVDLVFRLNKKTVPKMLFWGIAVPVIIYNVIKSESVGDFVEVPLMF
jgi:hypothetical protein